MTEETTTNAGEPSDDATVALVGDWEPTTIPPSPIAVLKTIVDRELRTVTRTRTYVALTVALAAIAVGLAVAGGSLTAGYGPAVIDLLTPMELLLPVVAVAFGYRAVLGDARRGELDVLRTYPLDAWQHVLGVYVGRAAGVVAAIVVPLVLVGGLVAVIPAETVRVFATHEGVDSPILFARFVVLSVLFGLVVLSMAIAVSAVATSTRSALALVAVVLILVVVGADVALVSGLGAGWIPDSTLVYATALSPNSAYRGLVLETAIGVSAGPRAASPLANLLGLSVWGIVGLVVATIGLRRQ